MPEEGTAIDKDRDGSFFLNILAKSFFRRGCGVSPAEMDVGKELSVGDRVMLMAGARC